MTNIICKKRTFLLDFSVKQRQKNHKKSSNFFENREKILETKVFKIKCFSMRQNTQNLSRKMSIFVRIYGVFFADAKGGKFSSEKRRKLRKNKRKIGCFRAKNEWCVSTNSVNFSRHFMKNCFNSFVCL